MKPTRCPNCQAHDLAFAALATHQADALFYLGYFRAVPANSAACLRCGVITAYLDDDALAKVREWSGVKAPIKQASDEV